jgi:hypothetical protein
VNEEKKRNYGDENNICGREQYLPKRTIFAEEKEIIFF